MANIIVIAESVLKTSEVITEAGEIFADKIDEEISKKKIEVSQANQLVQKMILIQKEYMALDRYCRNILNAFQLRDILRIQINYLENNLKMTMINNSENQKQEALVFLPEEEINEFNDAQNEYTIEEESTDEDKTIVPSSTRRVRKSRSLIRAVKTIVKKVGRSLSSSRKNRRCQTKK